MFEILILIITLLANRLNLNSTNTSKLPHKVTLLEKAPRKRPVKSGWARHVGTADT